MYVINVCNVCMYVCVYVCMSVCLYFFYVCYMFVCMYVCMHVCIYVCIYVYNVFMCLCCLMFPYLDPQQWEEYKSEKLLKNWGQWGPMGIPGMGPRGGQRIPHFWLSITPPTRLINASSKKVRGWGAPNESDKKCLFPEFLSKKFACRIDSICKHSQGLKNRFLKIKYFRPLAKIYAYLEHVSQCILRLDIKRYPSWQASVREKSQKTLQSLKKHIKSYETSYKILWSHLSSHIIRIGALCSQEHVLLCH